MLAPLALFGVLNTLVEAGNPSATVGNIVESEGAFRLAIAAFLVVAFLDFHNAWDIMLAIFGLHLLGVGVLVYASVQFPRLLVVIDGVGYLADTFTRILGPSFDVTFSVFTFVGEALLIVWFLWWGIKGFTADTASHLGHLDAVATRPSVVTK